MTENTIPIPPLSDGTRAAIANLVDYTIEREYGQSADAELAGAKTLAMGGLHFDLRALHIAWHDAARADQDAAMAGGGDWFDNVMPEPSVAQQAAHAAYQERLEFLAGCR